jgi:DNA-binding CsgD family transcriptional regulator
VQKKGSAFGITAPLWRGKEQSTMNALAEASSGTPLGPDSRRADLAAVRDDSAEFRLLWDALTSGEHRIVEAFFDEHSSRFLLCRNDQRERLGLSSRQRRIFRRVLLEADRKVVAAELGLADSTVHAILKQCLQYIGLSCAPGQVPPLLLLAARAGTDASPSGGRWTRARVRGRSELSVASAPRPEVVLRSLLSDAQYEVLRHLLEGKSYAQIARLRRTAVRTVANQVAASFRLLDVSGRSHLLRQLVNWPQRDERSLCAANRLRVMRGPPA